jgi:hypothetical protein
MKSKMRRASVGDDQMSSNDKVRIEIQTFLQALSSYPDRFKRHPGITFEEHRGSLIPAAEAGSPRRS